MSNIKQPSREPDFVYHYSKYTQDHELYWFDEMVLKLSEETYCRSIFWFNDKLWYTNQDETIHDGDMHARWCSEPETVAYQEWLAKKMLE